MAKYIFFDLETSDLNFVGQILTFSFCEVDGSYRDVLDRFDGAIQINRLNLPMPDAIAANKIDVEQHQTTAPYIECEAMQLINQWLITRTENEQTFLLGKNSYKFDTPFLIASMIRNGINPYLGINLVNRDVQHLIAHLFWKDENFRNQLLEQGKRDNARSVRSLENVCKALGILKATDKQRHDAAADVDLTIELCQKIRDDYGIVAHDFYAYEDARKFESHGNVITMAKFDFDTQDFQQEVIFPHDFAKNQALWLNVSSCIKHPEYEDPRLHFKWVNRKDGYLEVSPDLCQSPTIDNFLTENNLSKNQDTLTKIALKYREKYSDVTLDNYFDKRNCDIEQHIYNLSFDGIKALFYAIWFEQKRAVKDHDESYCSVLFQRFFLNYSDVETLDRSTRTLFNRLLKEYSEYRYGDGLAYKDFSRPFQEQYKPNYVLSPDQKIKLKVHKFDTKLFHPTDPGSNKTFFHPTLEDMFNRLNKLKKQYADDQQTTNCLNSLEQFYLTSDIYQMLNEK